MGRSVGLDSNSVGPDSNSGSNWNRFHVLPNAARHSQKLSAAPRSDQELEKVFFSWLVGQDSISVGPDSKSASS